MTNFRRRVRRASDWQLAEHAAAQGDTEAARELAGRYNEDDRPLPAIEVNQRPHVVDVGEMPARPPTTPPPIPTRAPKVIRARPPRVDHKSAWFALITTKSEKGR